MLCFQVPLLFYSCKTILLHSSLTARPFHASAVARRCAQPLQIAASAAGPVSRLARARFRAPNSPFADGAKSCPASLARSPHSVFLAAPAPPPPSAASPPPRAAPPAPAYVRRCSRFAKYAETAVPGDARRASPAAVGCGGVAAGCLRVSRSAFAMCGGPGAPQRGRRACASEGFVSALFFG